MIKTKKKNVASIVVLVMFLCLSMTMSVHAAAQKLNKKSVTLESGKTVTLKVIGSKKKVTWHSTNAKVAKVNKKGKVTGKKPGTATVYTRVAGGKLKCKVTVIELNKKSVSLKVGKNATLKVRGTKAKVTWKSKNPNVATVNRKGKVIGKKQGKTTIIAKVAKKKLKCKVTVEASETPAVTPDPEPEPTPLTKYWPENSKPAKALRDYVSAVTNEKDSKNYIPKKDRIAVFDMDGTLTCETYFTYFDTMMFIEYCLKDHPDEVSEELKAAARELKPGYTAGEELARNFAKAYKGMTVKELYDYAVEFGNRYTASFTNMRYLDGFYLPMVEVVKYLYDNGFTIYVISGTERTTTRAIVANSPIADYVTPNHVIGTEFEVKVAGHEDESSNMNFKYVVNDELVFTGGFIQKNLNANKSIWIEREIGQRPVLAFGNSGSDTSMLNYTIDPRNPYPTGAYMVVADDTEREWGPQNWEKKSQEYIGMGYIPISMKNDFLQIYNSNIKKAPEQYKNDDSNQQSGATGSRELKKAA